jgi:hypothetical protein
MCRNQVLIKINHERSLPSKTLAWHGGRAHYEGSQTDFQCELWA